MRLLRDEESIVRRNTKQRAVVLEAVREHTDHPTAEEIYSSVRLKDNKISKATVYRNLKELSRTGKVNHIKVPGADRYDLRVDLHYHIICTECAAVYDVPVEYEAELDEAAADATGFIVSRHRTVFEGICPECRKSLLK